MVDRVSISTNRIICRDSSSNVTFDTNRQYLKSDVNGDFEAGGVLQAPVVYGSGLASDMFYGPQFSGYPVRRNYAAGVFWTTGGGPTTNTWSFDGVKGGGVLDGILTGVTAINQVWYAVVDATASTLTYQGFSTKINGVQNTQYYWVPTIYVTNAGNFMYPTWPLGVLYGDGESIEISPVEVRDMDWYDFTNLADRTTSVHNSSAYSWATVDLIVRGDAIRFGLTVA